MGGADKLHVGNLIFIKAWIVAKLDWVFKQWRGWRIGIQITVFFGGVSVVGVGLACNNLTIRDTGVAMCCLAMLFGLIELLFYIFAMPCLKRCVISSIQRSVNVNQNLKGSMIASRMDGALDIWLSRNCPRVNYQWVRDELQRIHFH